MRRKKVYGVQEYFLWLAILSIILVPNAAAVRGYSSNRYYAGYTYGAAKWGVKGRIKTISPDVPSEHFVAEWITVILDYNPLQWIQTGFLKKAWWIFSIKQFFIEKNDDNGHYSTAVNGGPDTDTRYDYLIVHAMEYDQSKWNLEIKEGTTVKYSGHLHLDPYAPINLQAMIETTKTNIEIDGSHFQYLRYFTGRTWPYWNGYSVTESSPYEVDEISAYEFEASGGG